MDSESRFDVRIDSESKPDFGELGDDGTFESSECSDSMERSKLGLKLLLDVGDCSGGESCDTCLSFSFTGASLVCD